MVSTGLESRSCFSTAYEVLFRPEQAAHYFTGPIVAVPSFFKILFTWDCPERPNGVITHYEVQTDQTSPMDVGLDTEFTVSGLELGTEIRFSVRAYTGEGAGQWRSVITSSLKRPRK